jgi:hypothetical protein
MGLAQYETYIHTDVSVTTIDDFLSARNSIAAAFKDNKQELLDYDGDTGEPNTSRILEKYTDEELEGYLETNNLELLKPNTTLLIPKTQLNKELISISGIDQFLEQSDFNGFFAKSLVQLLSDPLYQQKDRDKIGDNEVLTTIYPEISVWIYIGALDSIINVSEFVMSCNISVGKEGGEFSITLPPIVELNSQDISNFEGSLYSSNNINVGGISNSNNEFYFHKYIQENDIVFIKFEQLEIEQEERQQDFTISKSALSGQIYDMIGLVNSNSKSSAYGQNDVSINITGNDLMKLLIDDGSYFFPLLFTVGAEDTFVNKQQDTKLIQRVWSTGNYNSLFAYSLRGIADTLQFIINQLANLGVVGEEVDLFSSYGDRRTKVYRLENQGDDSFSEELHNGVWQIIKLLVDGNIADRRVADSSISQPDGSLIVQFQKICQEPFVEFWGDTYGDFYNFIVRQPPYTKSTILSFLNGVPLEDNTNKSDDGSLVLKSSNISQEQPDLVITIDPKDIITEDISWEVDQIYSWYELKPQGTFLGSTNSISLAQLPIVYFPEYANKWGCKKMGAVSNYISYRAFNGKDTDTNRDLFKEALINDYKYLIESNMYLPFTRKGSIVINGDRRYKRGTWVRHGGTNEVYYVESVINDYNISESSIDRTTILTLSRGMVEKYIKGYNGLSYFDIIDTDTIRDVLLEKLTSGGQSKTKPRVNVKSNFGVNPDAFDFFYSRQQMEDNI